MAKKRRRKAPTDDPRLLESALRGPLPQSREERQRIQERAAAHMQANPDDTRMQMNISFFRRRAATAELHERLI